MLRAGFVLVLALPLLPPAVEVRTEHYRLAAEVPPDVAEEMGRVLEAAWPRFAEFFGRAPDLEEGERLPVRFFAAKEGFDAALREAGARPPAAGGLYWPPVRTAFLWRQPTLYNTRTLLLHETSHQFHFLARTRNRAPPAGWYVEGLAEMLGRHRWDGKTLVVGVIPTLSLTDFPAKALARFTDPGFDLARAVRRGGEDRVTAWALVSYLTRGEGGRLRRRFEKLAAKLDRGLGSADALFRAFGRPEKLKARVAAWLAAHQEPWTIVFNEWEGIGPGRFEGVAPPPIVSACRPKEDVIRLSAVLEVPREGRWTGGLLLHHESGEEYTTGMVDQAGRVRVARRRAGRWEILASRSIARPAPGGDLSLAAGRSGGKVTFRAGGETIGSFALPGSRLGLALQGCRLRFHDVRAEPAGHR